MNAHEYLKKQIDELTALLKKLILLVTSLKDSEEVDDSIEKVSQGLLELINMSLEEIINSPIEQFITSITIDNKMNNFNLDLLADLFFHLGHLYEKQAEKEPAKRLFNRSLLIYHYLLKIENDFSYERHIRIKELKEILLQ
jgi:hypothetical protein